MGRPSLVFFLKYLSRDIKASTACVYSAVEKFRVYNLILLKNFRGLRLATHENFLTLKISRITVYRVSDKMLALPSSLTSCRPLFSYIVVILVLSSAYSIAPYAPVFFTRAKTNILNVTEQIIFLKNEYSNILYIISISLITRAQEGLHNWLNKT